MGIEKKEMAIAKEVDDVMVLIVELIKDIKDKKDAAQIATENLAGLMAAIDGAQNIGKEVEDGRAAVMATVGYRAGELIDVLISGNGDSAGEVDAA